MRFTFERYIIIQSKDIAISIFIFREHNLKFLFICLHVIHFNPIHNVFAFRFQFQFGVLDGVCRDQNCVVISIVKERAVAYCTEDVIYEYVEHNGAHD